jgi:hypothetical protein
MVSRSDGQVVRYACPRQLKPRRPFALAHEGEDYHACIWSQVRAMLEVQGWVLGLPVAALIRTSADEGEHGTLCRHLYIY